MKKMYRTENEYSSGKRDIVSVIRYEIFELDNMDIPDYLLNTQAHLLSLETINELAQLNVKRHNYDEPAQQLLCEKIIKDINKNTNKDYKYCLWLAEKEAVLDVYRDEDEDINIDEYDISDLILSDLGYDGVLFAYEHLPPLPANYYQ